MGGFMSIPGFMFSSLIRCIRCERWSSRSAVALFATFMCWVEVGRPSLEEREAELCCFRVVVILPLDRAPTPRSGQGPGQEQARELVGAEPTEKQWKEERDNLGQGEKGTDFRREVALPGAKPKTDTGELLALFRQAVQQNTHPHQSSSVGRGAGHGQPAQPTLAAARGGEVARVGMRSGSSSSRRPRRSYRWRRRRRRRRKCGHSQQLLHVANNCGVLAIAAAPCAGAAGRAPRCAGRRRRSRRRAGDSDGRRGSFASSRARELRSVCLIRLFRSPNLCCT